MAKDYQLFECLLDLMFAETYRIVGFQILRLSSINLMLQLADQVGECAHWGFSGHYNNNGT